MANTYDIGQGIVLSAAFTVSGTPTDPDTVSLTYRLPDGTETTLTHAGATIARDSTGNYHANITATQAGSTTYQWVGTGADISSISGSYFVRRQEA